MISRTRAALRANGRLLSVILMALRNASFYYASRSAIASSTDLVLDICLALNGRAANGDARLKGLRNLLRLGLANGSFLLRLIRRACRHTLSVISDVMSSEVYISFGALAINDLTYVNE